MAVWKRVLTTADLAANDGTVGASVANGEQGLVTGNSVFDYIADQNFATGSGDIQSVNQGSGIETSATLGGTAADVASGDAFIRVKPAANGGIAVDSSGVSLASTVAGNGLTITNGVINVAGQSGITVTANAIAVNVDDSTVEVDGSTGDVKVKDGGISFAKFSSGAVHLSTDNSGNFTSVDTEVPTTRAVGLAFPNVTLAGVTNGAATTDYLQLNASGSSIQQLTMGIIDISDDTDLAVNNASNNQQDIDLTLSNSTLSATAPGLTSTSNVSFNNITAGGTLVVSGNVNLGDQTTDTVTIAGDLFVNGSTTTINTTELLVEDKIITLANVQSPSTTSANNAGIQIEASGSEAEFPELRWLSAGPMTGWHVEDYENGRTGDNLFPIAIMQVESNSTPTQTDVAAGVGSFWFDETTDALYICTSI